MVIPENPHLQPDQGPPTRRQLGKALSLAARHGPGAVNFFEHKRGRRGCARGYFTLRVVFTEEEVRLATH